MQYREGYIHFYLVMPRRQQKIFLVWNKKSVWRTEIDTFEAYFVTHE